MKTSIKMLLIFVGIVLLLVLASDVVLWAYFKKGINGDGVKLRFRDEVVDKEIVLRPFKAIVVSPNRGNQLEVIAGSAYKMAPMGLNGEQMNYKQEGDTLYLLPNDATGLRVYCPAVQLIRAAANEVSVEVTGFNQPSMEVLGLDHFAIDFTNVNIQKLIYKGGKLSSMDAELKSHFDSVKIELGLYGRINFRNTTLSGLYVKADSLQTLNLDKWGLLKLEKVERNYTMKGEDDRDE